MTQNKELQFKNKISERIGKFVSIGQKIFSNMEREFCKGYATQLGLLLDNYGELSHAFESDSDS